MRNARQPDQALRLLATVIAALAPVLGLVGWTIDIGPELRHVPEIFVRAMRLYIPSPDIIADETKNPILRTAASFGALSGAAGGFAIWMASANQKLAHLVTRYIRRGHTVVIGGTRLASHLAHALSLQGAVPVHVSETPPPNPKLPPDDRRIVMEPTPQMLARHAGLLRAGQVAIDSGSDAETLLIAKQLLAYLDGNGAGSIAHVAVRVADPVLADLFFEFARRTGLGQSVKVSAFDENTVAARRTLSVDPLFCRAAARGHKRVHALIVGFGDLGEKLFDQVMLTSVAGDLASPRITVVDRDAEALKRAFSARRPAVCDTLPVSFISLDVGADPLEGDGTAAGMRAVAAAEKEDPFTAIYLALPQAADNIRAALLLHRHQERTGELAAPIFYRSRGDGDGELLATPAPAPDADDGFIALPIPYAQVARTVLGDTSTETLARRLHESYLAGAGASAAAAKPWEDLPETLRRSNMRAADHLKAKLWTLGFKLCSDGGVPSLEAAERERLKRLVGAPHDDPLVDKLARIEHERWSIDRKLDGWVYGPERDDRRRIHPKLVPFDDLTMTREDIDKDVSQILAAIGYMLDAEDGA
ncbi:MAG: hypothetical protein KDJ68_10765 [Rhodobiaceae bacterium]|nr:hypothetical protein [Rhodobiaceae bacterium]